MVIYNNIKIIVVIKEMHIYLKRIINALEVDIDIDATFMVKYNHLLNGISNDLNSLLELKDRNIFIKVNDEDVYEVSKTAFKGENIEGYTLNLPNVLCIVKHKEYLINEKTTITCETFETSRACSNRFKLDPYSKWYINGKLVLIICRDYNCEETVGYYTNCSRTNHKQLNNMFWYLENYDRDFYEKYCSMNIDTNINKTTKEIKEFLESGN